MIMKKIVFYFMCLMALLSYSENGYCQLGPQYFEQGMNYHNNKDYENAAKYFLLSSDYGYQHGLFYLGYYFHEGLALPKDYEKAFTLWMAATRRGKTNGATEYQLGLCYLKGEGVAKNNVEAEKWFRKALADTGTEGIKKAAENKLTVVRNLIKAENGDADEQWWAGMYYEDGDGKDPAEAVKWFRKAAEQGNASGQKSLADCYRRGKGIEKDEAEAAKWYRKAADQGNEYAQEELGECYYKGKGVAVDKAEAVKWFRKSAEQGNKWAQRYLGDCYLNGEGVAADKAEAVKWYKMAAEQGDDDSIEKLKSLE